MKNILSRFLILLVAITMVSAGSSMAAKKVHDHMRDHQALDNPVKQKAIKAKNQQIAKYQCPMHPKVTSAKPGKCPQCHMDLVPIKGSIPVKK